MRERISLRLRPSESVVVRAAADIYSAHIRSGGVNDRTRKDLIEKSVQDAIEIARLTESKIRSDEELG